MFMPYSLADNCIYLQNCITDPDGLIEKIKNNSLMGSWQNCNPDSSDCFQTKLYHSKNNLYKKEIYFNKTDDLHFLYIINSIKMAFHFSSDLFCKPFNLKNNKSNSAVLYRQDISSIFDESFTKSKEYTAILFLNENLNSTPLIIITNGTKKEIVPRKGSMIVFSPNTEYNLGYFKDSDRYYSVYSFTSDII